MLLCIAGLFVAVGACTLYLAVPDFGAKHLALVTVPFVLSFGAAHFALDRFLPDRDPVLLPLAAMLTGLGLLLLGRLARNFLLRQAIWLPLCIGALLAVVRLGRNLRWLRRFRYTWLIGGLGLLSATLLLGVNPSGYGPRLWLGALGLYFQPSELLKLLMIVYLASYLAERQGLIVSERWHVGRWRVPPVAYIGPMLLMFGFALVVLAWQKDLGAAMLYFLTFLGMLYLATGRLGYPVVGLVLLIALGVVGYAYSDLVRLRIDSWWMPWPEASGRAFQIVQSLQAYGAGGIIGEGLGLGSPGLIPAVHTDFAHAALAEELGLAGALAIIALYAALTLRGFRIAARERSRFGQFLAAGIVVGFSVQSWVIMAGNAKLAPITGVTLPFVSYGGSSLLASCLALGLLMRVSGTAAPANHIAVSRLASVDPAETRARLARLAAILTVALAVLAVGCGYWALVRSSFLETRDDNVRRVLREQRIVRGRILDRNGIVLAEIEVADDGTVTRKYPVPEAAPALGYASLRYGTSGIEGAMDQTLRGEVGRTEWQNWRDDLLHRPSRGGDVQLTLDAELQVLAQELLAGVEGAAVVIDAATGEILVLASSPTFDPENLDEAWAELVDAPGAPLLNRATQGLYQPGSVFHTIVLAEALAADAADLAAPAPRLDQPVVVDGVTVQCDTEAAGPGDLADAYASSCPSPIVDLAQALGVLRVADAIARWDLGVPPSFEIPTAAPDWPGISGDGAPLVAEALGQGELVVSPVRVALVVATLGADGQPPDLHLVKRMKDAQGRWQELPRTGDSGFIVSPAIADAILSAWTPHDDGRIIGRSGTAIAGQDQPAHVWFTALSNTAGKRYAAVVLVEHAPPGTLDLELGRTLLRAALQP